MASNNLRAQGSSEDQSLDFVASYWRNTQLKCNPQFKEPTETGEQFSFRTFKRSHWGEHTWFLKELNPNPHRGAELSAAHPWVHTCAVHLHPDSRALAPGLWDHYCLCCYKSCWLTQAEHKPLTLSQDPASRTRVSRTTCWAGPASLRLPSLICSSAPLKVSKP